MSQRRRIRLRDGARQWSLLRDLENPRIWSESYHVPTWVEYVRHHQRRTQADGEVFSQLLALHRSEEHTSELQSLMRISYAVFCLKKKTNVINTVTQQHVI